MEAALISSLGRTILGTSIITIGRARDNGLVVSDPTVSSHHSEIRPDGQGYSIVDLGSTNGTFVNGQRLTKNTPRPLHAGDTIRIGDFTFTYEEEYPTSWGDTTNATQAIDETTGKSSPSPSSPDRILGLLPPVQAFPAQQQQRQATPAYQQPQHIPPPAPSPTAVPPQYGAYPSPPPSKVHPRNLAQEHLQFTAFHPRMVPVETGNTLLVYTYIESALEAILADAAKYKDKLGSHPGKAEAWASRLLVRGTQITIVPTFQGVYFNPESITFTWKKDWHPTIFSFYADRRWAGAVGSGEITIFTGPLIIASLRVSLRFQEQTFQLQVGDRANLEEVSVSAYRKIFASYSHDDTPIVLAIRKASEVIGDESLLDITNLRSGQNWSPSLLRLIDNSDIFQLFWSDRSAHSFYVRHECEYALQHYKYNGFIRPVYWEKPMRPPPPELSHLHFAFYEIPQKNSFFSRFSSMFSRK